MADDKEKEKKPKKEKPAKAAPEGGAPAAGDEAAAAAAAEKKAKREAAASEGKAKAAKEKKAKEEHGLTRASSPDDPPPRKGPPRLQVLYQNEVAPRLMKELGFKNRMQVPRLVKITLNMGLGEAIANPKVMDSAVEELRAMAGQKPVVTKAK